MPIVEKSEKLNEECAVFGVSLTGNANSEAAGIVYNGLLSLQHRGQEGAGIAVINNGAIRCHRNVGLVSEVFSQGNLERLSKGKLAVGHTRYSTTGGNIKENVGPFVIEYLTGRIAASHNGNVTNAREIRDKLKGYGVQFKATSDSEVLSALIAFCVTEECSESDGVIKAVNQLRGAFSLAIATGRNKLIAVRDLSGFRPLCIGESEAGLAVASESCALEACGFKFLRDVEPGEITVIENGKIKTSGTFSENPEKIRQSEKGGLCIFEYVYFARPDSVIDSLSVYDARYNMGARLAEEYPVEADVVCGVPDSGLEAAVGVSQKSHIPLAAGFVKNRYIGRSFIYPTQAQRDNAVRLKMNPLSANIKGKRIVLVDDSIVRGSTSEKIVKSLKNAGAAEVHVRISSPPFHYACHYGTDIDSEDKLIANKISLDEIRKKIGADSLAYISIDGLKQACGKCSLPFCAYCFTGKGAELNMKKDVLED
jgi:amidophosphoribosyltransferase